MIGNRIQRPVASNRTESPSLPPINTISSHRRNAQHAVFVRVRTRIREAANALRGGATGIGALAFANFASFILLCLVVFPRQAPVVMFRYDGTVLLSTALNQRRWMGSGLSYTMNFLEGNGGLWWAQIDTLFDPAFIIAFLAHNPARWPVIAFTIYASEFFIATVLLGRCLDLRLSLSLAAAWLGSLAAFPFFVPTLATNILWGNPHALPAMLLVAGSVWLLQKVGRGRWMTSVATASAVFAICAYLCFEFAGAVVQLVPTGLLIGAGCVCTAETSRERFIKLAATGTVALALAIVFGRFLAGLYLDTKGLVFPNDIWARPLSLANLSHLLAPDARFWGPVIWLSALGGALLMSIRATGTARIFAVCTLAMALFIAVDVSSIKLFIGDWRSFNPAYFDVYWFPFYCLFSICLLDAVVRFFMRQLRVRARSIRSAAMAFLVMLAVLPWLSLARAHPPYDDRLVLDTNPWRWPPKKTGLTDFLQSHIGLSLGLPFRGRVANLAGATFDKDLWFAPFSSQHNYDAIALIDTGNDHRLYGLWYFSIPTLIENNHFSSPFFHLVTNRLLNDGDILAGHAQTDLTKFDPRILAMLGTRYVITDREFNNGTVLRYQEHIDPQRIQYLYELDHPNVGDYSPTNVDQMQDATTALHKMADPAFDFRTDVILDRAVTGSTFTKAEHSTLRVFRDHLELNADSLGRSILLLPVEYSHCLEFRLQSGAPEPVEIRRANLEQTAVVFSRSVAGSIALEYGPFRNPGCRLADAHDAKLFRLGEVPRHP